MTRVPRPAGWWLLLALAIGGLAPAGVHAQPPAPSEVMLPVGTSGLVPTPFGKNVSKIEVVPPVVGAQLSFDAKNIEITALAPGFGQVRLLDATGAVLQVINVQILPPDLEVPFGEIKSFQAITGTTIQDVRVSTPDIVKFVVAPDKKRVDITGAALGTTKLTIIDSKGGFQVYNVAVVVSEKYLQFKIRQAVPTATVYPVQINKGVFILNGTVERSESIPAVLAVADSLAVKVINGLRVTGVMQVQLEVVLAEVSRSELRQMSFSWFNAGQRHFFASTFANATTPASSLATNLISPAKISNTLGGSSNLLLGFVNDKQSFFGYLTALRDEGLAKFITCPKLVTMSGKPAHFQSGGELAVPEPSGLGTNAVTFKNFGTRLNFLPIVLGDGKIAIEVENIVENRNDANGTVIAGTVVPGFDKQFAHATVEIESGQTFALGGMIQHRIDATTSKVPLLGDLPFLGTAFRTVSHNQVETELVIFVTPYLVDPMACTQLPKQVPGQETRIPDDFELFLEGIIEAPRGQRRVFPDGVHYRAAYLSSPSAGVFPCGGYSGNGGNGSCGSGSCGAGSCGGHATESAQPPVAMPTAAPAVAPAGSPKMTLPVGFTEDAGQHHGGQMPVPQGVPENLGRSMPSSPGVPAAMIAPLPAGQN